MADMTGKHKALWGRVVLVNLLAIAAVLGLAELAARRLSGPAQGDEQLPMCRPDETTIWRYRPGVDLVYRAPEFDMAVHTDGEGLRAGAAASGETPAAAPTVLAIGDSFSFGWGVAADERFTEVAGHALGGRRIVNAGHWMYTFDQQLVLLKALVPRHRPAVVVQGFYWPHVRTLAGHRLERTAGGSLAAVRDPALQVDAAGVLRRRSDWIEAPPLGSRLLALGARALLNRDLQRQAARWVDYMQPGSTADADLWSTADALVGETIDWLRARGIAYVPFLIPTSVEVGGAGWQHVGWFGDAPPAGVEPGLPTRRLQAMFAARGVPAVDLSPILRRAGGDRLYFAQDGHWNRAGHAAVGEALAPALAEALARTAQ